MFNGATTTQKEKDIEKILNAVSVLDFDFSVARKASNIYRNLLKNNKMIEFRDIFIGATAIENHIPLATINEKHFSRIDDLELIEI